MTGPSAALVLTPAPAITAYDAGQRFPVKFNRANTDTINISGIGPQNRKQYDATGAKVPAVGFAQLGRSVPGAEQATSA